jgi:hypothetical protein
VHHTHEQLVYEQHVPRSSLCCIFARALHPLHTRCTEVCVGVFGEMLKPGVEVAPHERSLLYVVFEYILDLFHWPRPENGSMTMCPTKETPFLWGFQRDGRTVVLLVLRRDLHTTGWGFHSVSVFSGRGTE